MFDIFILDVKSGRDRPPDAGQGLEPRPDLVARRAPHRLRLEPRRPLRPEPGDPPRGSGLARQRLLAVVGPGPAAVSDVTGGVADEPRHDRHRHQHDAAAGRRAPPAAASPVLEERAEITRLGRGIGGDGRLGDDGNRPHAGGAARRSPRSRAGTARASPPSAPRRCAAPPTPPTFLDPGREASWACPSRSSTARARRRSPSARSTRRLPRGAHRRRWSVVDIGGGSTEIVIATDGERDVPDAACRSARCASPSASSATIRPARARSTPVARRSTRRWPRSRSRAGERAAGRRRGHGHLAGGHGPGAARPTTRARARLPAVASATRPADRAPAQRHAGRARAHRRPRPPARRRDPGRAR